jgi:hypothetical protein
MTAKQEVTPKTVQCPGWRQTARDEKGKVRPIGGRIVDPSWYLQSLVAYLPTEAGRSGKVGSAGDRNLRVCAAS